MWILYFHLVQILMVYSLQKGCAILYDSLLLQNSFCMCLFIVSNLLDSYSAFFGFESAFLRMLVIPTATICDELKSTQAFMSGRVSIVYWGDHQLKASIHIFSFWKMLYNCFLAMHISFQKLLTIAAMINLSDRTRSWVMAPVRPRQEEWSWAGLLNSWALLFFFFKCNLYVKLPIYALNSHTEFRKWILFQDELAWEYLSEGFRLF